MKRVEGGKPLQTPIPTAKETVRKILDRLPDEASLEDIQYHIFVCQKVGRGLSDVDEGRTRTQEEAERRMSKWLID